MPDVLLLFLAIIGLGRTEVLFYFYKCALWAYINTLCAHSAHFLSIYISVVIFNATGKLLLQYFNNLIM